MGWYSAVGRRVFFALPPEAAHRVAGALLEFPFPWERIGGRAPADPRLRVSLAGIDLANPIALAAGFDKGCAHLGALGRLGFGYVVGGTVTRAPRVGHPKPRIARDRDAGSLVNAMGMPNPGTDVVARRLLASPRTAPRFVSLADEGLDDVLAAAGVLRPFVDGFELNASSPNATWAHEGAHIAEVIERLVARTGRPVVVKLPRFETDAEEDHALRLAVAARDAGAAALTCSNTRPVADARLAMGRGGLSGRPLAAGTPAIVRSVRAATGGTIPLNASGGIGTVRQALACLEAGATTVQIYTAMLFEGPGIVGTLARGLADVLRARGTDVPSLVGSA
jgi:dihydroorotate dehydrogenase